MLFSEYRGLPRPVYILFVARIINRMGDFVAMFLALFLTRYLGYSEARAGTVITLVITASVVGGLVGGRISDLRGRKKILIATMILSALFLGAGGFTVDPVVLPTLLIASQFFLGAMRPVNTALLVDSVRADQRQRAFSLLYLGINLGVAVGPLLAGFLFEHHRAWIFWGDALTTIAAAALVLFWVPETRGREEQSQSVRERAVAGSAFRAFFSRPLLLVYAICILGNNFVYAQHSFTLPLLLQEIFSAAGARYYGILMSTNAVAVLVFTPLLLRLLKRRSPASNLPLGSLLYALGFGMIAFMPGGLPWFLLSTLIWTWGEIILAVNSGVFIAGWTPVNHRARFNGILQMLRNAGRALSPAASGVLVALLGPRSVWFAVGLAALLLVLLLSGISCWDSVLTRREEGEASPEAGAG